MNIWLSVYWVFERILFLFLLVLVVQILRIFGTKKLPLQKMNTILPWSGICGDAHLQRFPNRFVKFFSCSEIGCDVIFLYSNKGCPCNFQFFKLSVQSSGWQIRVGSLNFWQNRSNSLLVVLVCFYTRNKDKTQRRIQHDCHHLLNLTAARQCSWLLIWNSLIGTKRISVIIRLAFSLRNQDPITWAPWEKHIIMYIHILMKEICVKYKIVTPYVNFPSYYRRIMHCICLYSVNSRNIQCNRTNYLVRFAHYFPIFRSTCKCRWCCLHPVIS